MHNLNDHDRTTTDLERACDAATAAMQAFAYPSDVLAREGAIHACALVGMSYLDLVASTMEQTNASADTARHNVAVSFVRLVDRLIGEGHAPRRGIGADGLPTGPLGRPAYFDPPEV